MQKTALYSAIVLAMAAGRIQHPVVLDGDLITPGQPTDADGPLVVGGWIFDGASPIGAPKSAGCEALRRELIASGGKRFADKIPVHHVICWWAPPVQTTSFAVLDQGRFRRPTDTSPWPLTQLQWDSIVDNLWSYNNLLYGAGAVEGGSAYTARLRAAYRGEPGVIGFVAQAIEDSRRQGGLPAAVAMWRPNPFEVCVYERQYALDAAGNAVPEYYTIVRTADLPDHCVYDRWWDGRTDEAVTRYYRAWAVAYGARIPAQRPS